MLYGGNWTCLSFYKTFLKKPPGCEVNRLGEKRASPVASVQHEDIYYNNNNYYCQFNYYCLGAIWRQLDLLEFLQDVSKEASWMRGEPSLR